MSITNKPAPFTIGNKGNMSYGLRSTCLRYFNVYGERQLLEGAYSLVMGKFVQQRLNGEPMTIRGDGEQRRDFTYVGDVSRANILAALSENPLASEGTPINIGNGDNRSVNEIADMIGGEPSFPEGDDFNQPVAKQQIPANGPVRFFHNQTLVLA
mgnify:CR=1 FL=1